MGRLAFVLLGCAWLTTALAQTPEDALSSQWTNLCAGAAPGSDLAQRCVEIVNGGAGGRDIAAAGNFLEEIPGQGRSATRDGAPGSAVARQSIAAHWSLFASVDMGRLDRRDSANEAAFAGDTQALTAGVDWAPSQSLLLAAAFNVSEETLDYRNSAGSAKAHYDGLIGTASWNLSPNIALLGYAGRLNGSNELRRAIDYTLLSGAHVSALASASPDSTRTMSGLGLDWSLPHGAWQWRIGAGMDWMKTRLESYTESGGDGLALAVPTRQIVTRRGRLDLGLGRTISARWGVWQPQLMIGWRHEFANASRTLGVRFIGDGLGTPIRFDTEDPDNAWGEVAIGSVFTFTHGHSGFIQYRQRFGHDFLQDRLLSLGWRLELH